MLLACIIFICVACLTLRSFTKNFFMETPYMFLDGKYSLETGDWKPIDRDEPINETFHRISFRGTIPRSILDSNKQITVTAKNIWITMSAEDCTTIIDNRYDSFEELVDNYWPKGMERASPDAHEEYNNYVKTLKEKHPATPDLPETPGYLCVNIDTQLLKDIFPDADVEYSIEIENPYQMAPARFSDVFSVTISDGNGVHQQLIENMLPMLILFAAVCMFGVLFFPVASIVLGRVDFKYLSFGALCFFWGIYMIMNVTGSFLNYWVYDATECLFVDKMNANLFALSLIVYFRSNLTKPVSRMISAVLAIIDTIVVVTAAALHIFAATDMVISGVYINIAIGITAIVFIILLSGEVKSSHDALLSMIMWTPMIMSLIIDICNQFASFSSIHFFTYGLGVTMGAQLVRSLFDLRKQRLEAIRYQQVQKELYEAKVQVMVSQIRPHFMYNALSSIAMLCKIKPETAYEATINFSDYLRGNMDSLKQTAPVPFRKELEHLEKYLYIEKLRFGKKLNIEYDIQADSFEIPLLSVQPLVENAVKHGVGMKEDGGTVTIATRETEENYEIIVSDDGVGFDTSEVKNDGRSHVGMENTKRRLKDMCNADVVITSVIGEGTTARIIIPKTKQETE